MDGTMLVDGLNEGALLGRRDGRNVTEGPLEGEEIFNGIKEGTKEGTKEGCIVGLGVGSAEGLELGSLLGTTLGRGLPLGLILGEERFLGALVGSNEGDWLSSMEGYELWLGAMDGEPVGS